jgi:uncharacterized protein (UPF0332 family)
LRPETAQYLETARDMLARGQRMCEVGLIEDAGRAAYLAAFHAAQALIFEREGRALKTHHGVQSEFAKLLKDDPSVQSDLRGFVSRSYGFKTIADYDPHTSVPPTPEDIRAAWTRRDDLSRRSCGSSGRNPPADWTARQNWTSRLASLIPGMIREIHSVDTNRTCAPNRTPHTLTNYQNRSGTFSEYLITHQRDFMSESSSN